MPMKRRRNLQFQDLGPAAFEAVSMVCGPNASYWCEAFVEGGIRWKLMRRICKETKLVHLH